MDPWVDFYKAKCALMGVEATPRWAYASVTQLQLWVYEGAQLLKSYKVSTSAKPASCQYGSGGTPLGLHQIAQKIGAGMPWGTIFEKREPVGQFEKGQPTDKPMITTRILWLDGLEENKNRGYECGSHNRKIYIHSIPDEAKIGTPHSHGCIELTNDDVIELFELMSEKDHVLID